MDRLRGIAQLIMTAAVQRDEQVPCCACRTRHVTSEVSVAIFPAVSPDSAGLCLMSGRNFTAYSEGVIKRLTLLWFGGKIETQVKVYDDDTITDDDGLGKAEFTLGNLMSAPGGSISVRLKKRSGRTAK